MKLIVVIFLLCLASVALAGDFTMPTSRGRSRFGIAGGTLNKANRFQFGSPRFGLNNTNGWSVDPGVLVYRNVDLLNTNMSTAGLWAETDLNLQADVSSLFQSQAGIYNNLQILSSSTANYTTAIRGFNNVVTHNGSGNVSTLDNFNVVANASTGTITTLNATGGTATNSSSGNITTMNGISLTAQNTGTGTVTTQNCATASMANSGGGTITTTTLFLANRPTGATTGKTSVWTNLRGVDVEDMNPSGAGTNTLTNAPIALRVASQTATGGYGIKFIGAGINVLGTGNTMVGLTSDPTGQFVVGTQSQHFHLTQSTKPVITSGCGTSPSTITGTDQFGTFTTGSGTPGVCLITFHTAFSNAPICMAVDNNVPAILATTEATTTLTITMTVANASHTIKYHCDGWE